MEKGMAETRIREIANTETETLQGTLPKIMTLNLQQVKHGQTPLASSYRKIAQPERIK
jgi:hypothetical protein